MNSQPENHTQMFGGEGGNGDTPVSSRGEPKGPPAACLFVASLSGEASEDGLRAYFAQFGPLLKLRLLKDRSSRPYAFVQFLKVEDANAALQNTNGKLLEGRRLRVERAKVNRTLFVAKMSRTLTNQAKLREIAEAYGPVESVTIIKNHQTNRSKGCGFIKYVYREDAMDAFIGLKNSQRKWVVEWATSTNDPDMLGVDKFSVFVGGLNPALVTRELLEERFGAYGHLESVTLINKEDALEGGDDNNPRSAFSFLRFSDVAASATAIEHEDGAEWLERRIRVQYCESQEMKNKRRAAKYLNTMNQFNTQFYRGMQVPAPMLMQPLPSIKMNGLPAAAMYNMPVAGNMQKFNPYMRKDVQSPPSLFSPFPPYPMMYANSQPWIFPQQQHQQQQQRVDTIPPSSDDSSSGAPEPGGVPTLTNSLAQMSLHQSPSQQRSNPW